jgi:hypothetical protein
MHSTHSPAWWRRHWERTQIVDMERADSLGNRFDRSRSWPLPRLQSRGGPARSGIALDEPIVSVPSHYVRKPLLRGAH